MHHLFYYVLLGWAACAVFGSWGYFRRYQVGRPPIGVFNLRDITLMIVFILLVPFLYLVLPLWIAAGLLGLSVLSVLYFTWEPLLRARWAIWLVVLALLGAFLAVYDVLATSAFPLTSDLFTRLAGLPLAPIIAWSSGSKVVGIGLGDLLLAAVFPLVMRKAFDRAAGIMALVLTLSTVGILLALPLQRVFPVMVVLGPLMVLQYLYWRGRRGRERTTWQYLQREPVRLQGAGSPPKLAR